MQQSSKKTWIQFSDISDFVAFSNRIQYYETVQGKIVEDAETSVQAIQGAEEDLTAMVPEDAIDIVSNAMITEWRQQKKKCGVSFF
jgi:hypothetical protein